MTIVPIVVGYFAIQWNRANFLGKSPEQIVAMGREKWSDLYGKKFGQATRDICDADEKFGIALRNLNDRAITRLPRNRQIWLQEVRETTQEFAFEAHQVGSKVGGESSEILASNSAILPDVEQVISDCIINKPLPPVQMKSFASVFLELDQAIFQAREVQNISDYSGLLKHRTNLAGKHSKLISLLEKGCDTDSMRIQMYMQDKIKVAKNEKLT